MEEQAKKTKHMTKMGNFVLNAAVFILPMLALQFVLYPYLASRFSAQYFGIILLVTGLINVLVQGFGNALNKTRLVQEDIYSDKGLKGDFNLFMIIGLMVGALGAAAVGLAFKEIRYVTKMLLVLFFVFGCLSEYLFVGYRLKSDFLKSFISSAIISAAYIAGMFLSGTAGMWPVAFVFAGVAGCVYMFFTLSLHKEPFKKTELFFMAGKKYLGFIATSLVICLLFYADRYMIYLMLDETSVSAYTAASFFGKSLGIIIIAITGVLLRYWTQKGTAFSKKQYKLLYGIGLFLAALFAGFAYYVSPWFTHLLYPSLFDKALPYLQIANLAAIIGAVSLMAQQVLVRLFSIGRQLVIQIVYAAVYIGLGIWLMKEYGLSGFCYAALIANIVGALIMYIAGHKKLKQEVLKMASTGTDTDANIN